jgi:hypothetical protein
VPDSVLDFGRVNPAVKGFFRFGSEAVCFGELAGVTRAKVNGNLHDASQAVRVQEKKVLLPFDVDQVLNNLRYERYVTPGGNWLRTDWERPNTPYSVCPSASKHFSAFI